MAATEDSRGENTMTQEKSSLASYLGTVLGSLIKLSIHVIQTWRPRAVAGRVGHGVEAQTCAIKSKMASFRSGASGFYCCSFNCNSAQYVDGKATGIHFFKFPSEGRDKKKKQRWCNLIKRHDGKDNFVVNSTTRVCEKHFNSDDIKKGFGGQWRLKPNAEPSVFSWSKEKNQRNPPKERIPTKRKKASETLDALDVGSETFVNEHVEKECSTSTGMFFKNKMINAEVQTEDESMITELNQRVAELEEENKNLRQKIAEKTFCTELIKDRKDLIKFYTGFPNWDRMEMIYNYLNPEDNVENMILYNRAKDNVSEESVNPVDHDHNYIQDTSSTKVNNVSKLPPKEQFLLILCRIKQGINEKHLEFLFGVSQATVSRYFVTWINYMYLKLGSISIWPPRSEIRANMPPEFKRKFPDTRVIIDCTEISVQMPDSLVLQKMMYSSYKHKIT